MDLRCGFGTIYSVGSSLSKLFTIGRCKNVWVADHMQFHNGNIQEYFLYKTCA
jgi:hypothetical protein